MRFSHILIRDTLYDGLTTDGRAGLHRVAAEVLEDLYADSLVGHQEETPERVLALARHWFEAGVPERAISCYRRGAELALRVFANYEAAEALTRALDLLRQAPESRRRDEDELELTILLASARGWGSPEYPRARDLFLKLGRDVSPPILRGLALNSLLRLEVGDAREHGIALLQAGKRAEDPVLIVEGEYLLGVTSFWKGDFSEARRHLDEAIDRYSLERSETHLTLFSQDPKVVCLSRLAWAFCFLGHPEQAAEARDAALSLGDEVGHPFSRCYASLYGSIVSQELNDESLQAELVETAETVATIQRFPQLQAWSAFLRHWSLARRGDRDAIGAMNTAIAHFEETQQTLLNTYFLSLLARAYLVVDEPTLGLEAVSNALLESQRTGARYLESELQRIRGELLIASGAGAAEIETAFGLAQAIARRQEAKALEVRAADALTRWRPARR